MRAFGYRELRLFQREGCIKGIGLFRCQRDKEICSILRRLKLTGNYLIALLADFLRVFVRVERRNGAGISPIETHFVLPVLAFEPASFLSIKTLRSVGHRLNDWFVYLGPLIEVVSVFEYSNSLIQVLNLYSNNFNRALEYYSNSLIQIFDKCDSKTIIFEFVV